MSYLSLLFYTEIIDLALWRLKKKNFRELRQNEPLQHPITNIELHKSSTDCFF